MAAPSRFCVDIDNVIAQTDKVMRNVIREVTQNRVQLEYQDIIKFDYCECLDKNGNSISKDEWKKVHKRFSDQNNLMRIEPMPGAVDGLSRLVENGLVHLATSRIHEARKPTIEWLDAHKIPHHDLHFLTQGERHASLRPFTAAVDDNYEQALAFARQGQTRCFLLRHPWNENERPTKNVEWATTWADLTERLLRMVP
jgi:uncharacterized HAD superfamily protein